MKKIIQIILIILILLGVLLPVISPVFAQEVTDKPSSVTKIKGVFNNGTKPVEIYIDKINLGLTKFPSSSKTECSSYTLVEKRVNVISNTIVGSKEIVTSSNSVAEIKTEFEIVRQAWNDNKESLYKDYLDLSMCAYDIYVSEINGYLEYAGYMSKYVDLVGGNGEAIRNEIDIVNGELASSKKYYRNGDFWSGLKEIGRVKDNIKNIQIILITYK